MAQQTPAKQLFDLLVTKNFDPEALDSTGRPAQNPAEADIFSFDYESETGNDYGTVVVMLGDEGDLQVYFGDNLGRGMEQEDKTEWFNFLHQLKNLATKNLLSFGLKDLNKLKYSMQGQAKIKEGVFESWTGNKTTSWNGRPTEARLMIKHKRPLDETDARFRYIESLFIETADGERFKLPFTKLTGGRAMLEHVRQGGRVWDSRGQHITEMVNELNVLSRFRRANHGKVFEGDTKDLVEQTNAYYETSQKVLKSLGHARGYTTYFESWNPGLITEQEAVVEGIKQLFVTQNIDQRIEDALPLIARIQQQENAMKEAAIFEAWVNNLAEGTWSIPDTPEKQDELVELLSKDLPVGADATNATEQLYDLLGDDELFDQLYDLAKRDANADARQVVLMRMQELSDDPDVRAVVDRLNIDATAAMDPPEQTPADLGADDQDMKEAVKDPYTQTEDPADTKQPEYPEYAQDLMSILKHAGVPAKERMAPDYEAELEEESLKDVKTIGGDAADNLIKDIETDQRGTYTSEEEDQDDDKKELDEIAPVIGAIGGALGRAAMGATAKAGLMTAAGAMKDVITGDDGDDQEEVDEAKCNMTESGESCPVHGMKECYNIGMLETHAVDEMTNALTSENDKTVKETALQGQYGHSGKLKAVGESPDFLTRLKELSGMIRN